jgi:hypothetical protein
MNGSCALWKGGPKAEFAAKRPPWHGSVGSEFRGFVAGGCPGANSSAGHKSPEQLPELPSMRLEHLEPHSEEETTNPDELIFSSRS